MTREERRRLWIRQFEGWKASGLSQWAYCERESISFETFRRWRRKLGEQSTALEPLPRFVPVRVAQASGSVTSQAVRQGTDVLMQPVEVVLSSGRRLRFADGLNETGLARLIRLLEVLPC